MSTTSPSAPASHHRRRTPMRAAGSGRWVLYRGTAGALAVQAGGAGLGLLVHAVVARLVGPSAYGAFTLALTWVGVLSVLALLGQGTSVVRFTAQYVQQQAWAELNGIRRASRLIVLTASLAVSLIATLVVLALKQHLERELELTLLAGFVLLPVLTQLQLSGALHRGLKRAVSAGAFNNLIRPVVLLAAVVALSVFAARRLTAPLAMLASCLGAMAALASSEWALKRALPEGARRVRPRYQMAAWLALGRQLFFLTAMGIVLSRVDVLVLGALGGVAEVGPYYAAVQLAAVAAYGLDAVNTILAPMIAERYAARDRIGLAQLVNHAARLTFVVTAVLSVGTAVLGRWVLSLFGTGFEAAYGPLLVILAGQCLNAAMGPVDYLMTMTEFERQAPVIFGGGALVNLVLSLMLVPGLGMFGAALATSAATVFWNVVAVLFVRRRLRINPTLSFLHAMRAP